MRRLTRLVVTATWMWTASAVAEPSSSQRVGVYTLDEGAPAELADALDAAAEQVVARRTNTVLVSIGELAQPTTTSSETQIALAHAQAEVAESDQHFARGETDEAKRLLEDALESYQRFLPELVAQAGQAPLIDAWSRLARARYFAGDRPGALAALSFVLAIDPKTPFTKARFGAPLERAVVEAKLAADMAEPGHLAPESDPAGAEVLLDGNPLPGRTPIDNVACAPGPHYVSFRQRGYVTQTTVFAVESGSTPQRAVRLLDRLPLLRPLYRMRPQLDEGHVELASAFQLYGVDQLLLIRAETTSTGALTLHIYRIDRDGRVQHRQSTGPEASAPLDVGPLVEAALDGPARPLARTETSTWQRFRRWPGFWYVVGGAAALVVGTAVGVGVGVGTRPAAGDQTLILTR